MSALRKQKEVSWLDHLHLPQAVNIFPTSIFPYILLQSSSHFTYEDVGSDNQQFGLADIGQRKLKGNIAPSSPPSMGLLHVASLLYTETGCSGDHTAYKCGKKFCLFKFLFFLFFVSEVLFLMMWVRSGSVG
jgi:hypothetical protein